MYTAVKSFPEFYVAHKKKCCTHAKRQPDMKDMKEKKTVLASYNVCTLFFLF